MSRTGGSPRRLTTDPAIDRPGSWSPDGRRMHLEGGKDVRVLEHGQALRWELLEEGIVFLNDGGAEILSEDDSPPTPTLELFDFGTGETRRLAVLPNAAPWGLSVSPDRRWVVYTGWEPPEADIMLVEGFR